LERARARCRAFVGTRVDGLLSRNQLIGWDLMMGQGGLFRVRLFGWKMQV